MPLRSLFLGGAGLSLLILGAAAPYLAVDLRLREELWAALPPPLWGVLARVGAGLALGATLVGLRWRRVPWWGLPVAVLLLWSVVPLSMNALFLSAALGLRAAGAVLLVRGLAPALAPRIAAAGTLLRRVREGRFLAGLFLAGLLLHVGLAFGVFGGRPGVIDTMDQVFQARIFATGRLTAPAPPLPRAFRFLYMIVREGRWYSQYPPGHPLLLTLGVLLGATWPVGPVLGALLPVLVYLLARDLWGGRTARVAGLVAFLSPYLHLMAGSHMSHTTSATALVLGAWGLVRLFRGGGAGAAAATGLGFGYALWTRPYEAFAAALAAGAAAAWLLLRGRTRLRPLPTALALVLAALPVVLLLLYNQATNGHPLLFGYNVTQGPLHKLGFGLRRMNALVRTYTLWEAVKQTGYHLCGLSLFALGAAVPAVALAPWTLLVRRRHPWELLPAMLAAAPVAAFFFYPFTDFVLGPRLVFAAIPFLALLAARSLLRLRRLDPRLPSPGVLALLFLAAPWDLLFAAEFNRRLHGRPQAEMAAFLRAHPLDRALVLCDDRVFGLHGFAALHPDLPPDRPLFVRDVHSDALTTLFPARPVLALGYDRAGRLRLEEHRENVVDLHALLARRAPEVVAARGMQTAVRRLARGPLRGETLKLLYGFTTPASVSYRLTLPRGARLRFSALVFPAAWERGSDGVTFEVRLQPADRSSPPQVLFHAHQGPSSPPLALLEREVSLAAWAGRTVLLTLAALPGPRGDCRGDVFDFACPRIVVRRPRP